MQMTDQRRSDLVVVAHRFAKNLLDYMDTDKLAEADRRNAHDPAYQSGACASHDFCDANVFMAQAFEDHLGLARDSLSLCGDESEGNQPVTCEEWNAAWDYARKSSFITLAKRV